MMIERETRSQMGETVKSIKGRRSGSLQWGTYGILGALILLWIGFNILSQGLFLSPRNMITLLLQTAVLAIVACGMVLIMVSGNIDLSVGSSVGLLTTLAAALQVSQHWSIAATISVTAVTGIVIGSWQGAWVAYGGIPAFIVTLGSMSLFRGITYLMTRGQTLAPMSDAYSVFGGGLLGRDVSMYLVIAVALVVFVMEGVRYARRRKVANPKSFTAKSAVRLAGVVVIGLLMVLALKTTRPQIPVGIPVSTLVVAAVVISLAFVANRMRFGRHLYAIGGNREAALLAGINVRLHIFLIFAIMGLLYALSSVVLSSRLNGAPPDPALNMELDAITSAVIGGTSLFGGVGTVGGAIIGALFLSTISNGMSLMGMSTFVELVVKGTVLLLAVFMNLRLKARTGA